MKKTAKQDSRGESLEKPRDALVKKKQALKDAFLKSGDVDALLEGYADAIDKLICGHVAGEPPVAVVAVGGYGRKELFPYSDIDLLFLYDDKEQEAAKVAEGVLYFLWDMGLTVGQAHRSIDEAIRLADEDITIRTNLLDARLLCGDAGVFAQFRARFEKEIAATSAMSFVEAKLSERDGRHLRFGDSRYMLEPNVKEGKGGLRDIHTLWWLARYAYGAKDLRELVKLKLLTKDEYKLFEDARLFLCRVRAHLHYVAGRAEERLSFDRQQALAAAMGFKHPSVNRSVERFMQRYFVAVRTVGSITRIFCALLEDEKKRKPRKTFAWLWNSPWKLGPYKIDGERLNVRHENAFQQSPVLMLEMFRVSQFNGIEIHPRALQIMARDLKVLDRHVQNDPKANAIVLDIILSERDAEATLRRMSEAGVLGKFIPDFGRIIGKTQFNMYHVYTVDEHTLVAIGLLHGIDKGLYKKDLPMATEIIKRLQMRKVLFVALMCHDIAKGRGGDHSELGEKVAEKLARRFGFSEDEIETTAWLVRNHLLFSSTAFKRDLDDPKTVLDFVGAVRSAERLKLLLVLTVADIRAVGPLVWNEWKASLLRELYTLAEQCMGTGKAGLKHHQTGQFKADLLKHLPGWEARDVEAYLDQGNPAFWAGLDLHRHAVVARMLRQSKQLPMPLLLDMQHDYERRVTEITVCTPDQHGLFARLAGAMALAGANIIGAKIFTLKGGMAVDIFQVQDGSGDVFDRPDKLAKMSVYTEQALTGEIDLAQEFAGRKSEYQANRNAIPVSGQVFVDNEASNICSVIEISGQDRVGFLYQVTDTMAGLGLSIITAHVSTYGTEVADVFYVKDIFGMKVSHEGKIRQVREKLLEIIRPV